MAKSALAIAGKISKLFEKGEDRLTFTWQEYYQLIERSRLSDSFQSKLSDELKKKGIKMQSGVSMIEMSRF